MKLHKKYLSIALIGLVCLPAGCGQGGSAQSSAPPAPTTTTLPVDQYPKTQIYFASDISLATQDRVRLTVSAAEGTWGVVESLEMWVVGLLIIPEQLIEIGMKIVNLHTFLGLRERVDTS